jgi:MoaA/NifB/PqqE/SkfB family radical SAM enzyme
MEHFQIETTTRCTLQCPACSRTLFANKLNRPIPHHDIDPVLLHKFLDCSEGRKIKELMLCGDYGDSIYYPRLFELVELFKPDKRINLITNGSYRDAKFWTELCARLDSKDTIRFSIDGLEDTNHLYRVNSDWASTMLGMDIVAKSGVKMIWYSNIFNFNYDRLDEIREFAQSKGAEFQSAMTGRFGNEALRPPEEFVNKVEMYIPEFSDPSHPIEIEPDCKNFFRNTVCSQNYFWPCGYIRSPFAFYKSQLWKERAKWSIENTTLTELRATALAERIHNIESDPGHADVVCKMRCKKNQQHTVRFDRG